MIKERWVRPRGLQLVDVLIYTEVEHLRQVLFPLFSVVVAESISNHPIRDGILFGHPLNNLSCNCHSSLQQGRRSISRSTNAILLSSQERKDSHTSLHAMAVDMSVLSRMQIATFFERNAPVTQKQCNDKAQSILGKSVTPTACQGGTSYTVDAGQVVVQFRDPSSPLDMSFMSSIEQAYPDFTPRHKDCGSFHNLHVYTMNNIGGISMYVARAHLQRNNYELLRNTIDSYARFVSTANVPAGFPLSLRPFSSRAGETCLRLTRLG